MAVVVATTLFWSDLTTTESFALELSFLTSVLLHGQHYGMRLQILLDKMEYVDRVSTDRVSTDRYVPISCWNS